MTKNRQPRRTKAPWQAVIGEQADSGMDIPGYCNIHKIPTLSFRKWRRKLQSERTEAAGFIEIPRATGSEAVTSAARRIELDLGHGMTLRVY